MVALLHCSQQPSYLPRFRTPCNFFAATTRYFPMDQADSRHLMDSQQQQQQQQQRQRSPQSLS